MLELIKNEVSKTLTENGAAAYERTGSECLDLFAAIGAVRNASDEEIIRRFTRAFAEDRHAAMKILFFARDIRGGLGERRVFRVIMRWLAENEPETVLKNIEHIAEYGRYDDLLVFLHTSCEDQTVTYLKSQLEKDIEAMKIGDNISLLAKWLPSINASNMETVKNGKHLAKSFNMKDSVYRKTLSSLRSYIKILENNLRKKDYTFDYSLQPSRAMFKYRKAFYRNDGQRYEKFLSKVERGEATLHADNVAPYELVEPYLTGSLCSNGSFMRNISKAEKHSLNATWNALPDFGSDENALAVIDTSGSMYCPLKPMPAAVALSLGIYFAERNKGMFKDHLITFSERPQLIKLKGEKFTDKLRYVCTFNEIANTNVEAVFDLILNTAVRNNVPQKELPSKLIIISDMEFDACVENGELTNFESAKRKYAAHGYVLPEIVFWNAASRHRHQPVTKNEQGAALVSGVTPRLFSMIAGGNLSPYKFMMDVLENERYTKIAA